MPKGSTKRVVVIKDIPSNIIEEAILILKTEPDSNSQKNSRGMPVKPVKQHDNILLLKEAELIINNYIKENSLVGQNYSGSYNQRRNNPQRKFITNMIINSVLAGSIVILILMIMKVI